MDNALKTYQELYFWKDQEKRMFCFSFMHIIHQDHVLTYQGYSGWWKCFEGQIPFCYPFLYPHLCMQEKNLMVESTRWKLLTFFLNAICWMHTSTDAYRAKNNDVFIDLSKNTFFLTFPRSWRDVAQFFYL